MKRKKIIAVVVIILLGFFFVNFAYKTKCNEMKVKHWFRESKLQKNMAAESILLDINHLFRVMTHNEYRDGNSIFLTNNYYASIIDENGYNEEITNNLQELNSFCNRKNIDFLYMQLPSKVCPFDKKLPLGYQDFQNENADRLIKELKDKNIDVLDIRDYMPSKSDEWNNMFYQIDCHWKPETAIWAAGILSEKLVEYGFYYDKKIFSLDNYNKKTYINGYKKITDVDINAIAKHISEEMNLWIPKFSTDVQLNVPEENYDASGKFKDVMFNKYHLENTEFFDRVPYQSYSYNNHT